MGQHGDTGQRPVFATCFGFLLCSTLTLFLQNFELRNFPQTTTVYFILFSTSLTPSVGTNTCFPKTRTPVQDIRPFRASPEAQPNIPIATKLPITQLYVPQLLAVDLMLGFCSWPTLWKRLGDLPLETGPHVLSLIQWEPLSSLHVPGPILDYPGHHLAYWSPSSQFLVASHGQTFGGTPHHPISSPRRVFSQSLASIGPECYSFMSSILVALSTLTLTKSLVNLWPAVSPPSFC